MFCCWMGAGLFFPCIQICSLFRPHNPYFYGARRTATRYSKAGVGWMLSHPLFASAISLHMYHPNGTPLHDEFAPIRISVPMLFTRVNLTGSDVWSTIRYPSISILTLLDACAFHPVVRKSAKAEPVDR